MKKNILKRSFELRESKEGKGIYGYAFRFNEIIDFFGSKETFSPDLTFETYNQGCYLLLNHNPERVLAKTPKTLRFSVDSQGLRFDADFINTPAWIETMELVKKSVLEKASVGFSVIKEKYNREKDLTTYTAIKLYEVSLVTWPAYQSSEVNPRHKVKSPRPRPPELLC